MKKLCFSTHLALLFKDFFLVHVSMNFYFQSVTDILAFSKINENGGLEEAQTGIRIAGRNINNLRYADYTTLMAETEEELKSILKLKEESKKVGLKLNIQKTMIMASLHGK